MWLKREEKIEVEIPPEWQGIIPSQVFMEEAKKIVEEASKKDILLRVMGGLGVKLHSLNQEELSKRIGRLGKEKQEFTDIDFMSYRKHRKKVEEMFKAIGYIKRKTTLSSAASERQIYFHPKGWFYVDVFYDKLLVANHPIDFRGRLELDYPTVTVTDLFLEKTQIVNFSEKDLKDVVLLLRAHNIGETEKETVNIEYVSNILSKDWGFYYTVTTNLKGIKKLLNKIEGLKEEDKQDLNNKLSQALKKIDEKPKTMKWKMRAKVGTRKRWYNPVETDETVGGFGIWRLMEK